MKTKIRLKNIIFWIVAGLSVGFLNGFFGGGGGMVVVPILICLFKLEEKKAHATALTVILPLCIASSVIYLMNNSLDVYQCLEVGIGFLVGGILGAFLLNKLNNNVLGIIFSILLIGAGIGMIIL